MLDNYNAKLFIGEAKKENIKLVWISIKDLETEENKKFQEFALKLAREKYNFDRAYLDLFFWPLFDREID